MSKEWTNKAGGGNTTSKTIHPKGGPAGLGKSGRSLTEEHQFEDYGKGKPHHVGKPSVKKSKDVSGERTSPPTQAPSGGSSSKSPGGKTTPNINPQPSKPKPKPKPSRP